MTEVRGAVGSAQWAVETDIEHSGSSSLATLSLERACSGAKHATGKH